MLRALLPTEHTRPGYTENPDAFLASRGHDVRVVAEPAGLDIERLARAMSRMEWAWLGWVDGAPRNEPRRANALTNAARALVAQYARPTADELMALTDGEFEAFAAALLPTQASDSKEKT